MIKIDSNHLIISIIFMDYSKYVTKYKQYINEYKSGIRNLKDYNIFEMLYAIELNLILWSDIPPNFDEIYDLPHKMDYGIDLIDLEYSNTCQVKKYSDKSRITWRHISCFHCYSTVCLKIHNMILATTDCAKIDSLVNKKLIASLTA